MRLRTRSGRPRGLARLRLACALPSLPAFAKTLLDALQLAHTENEQIGGSGTRLSLTLPARAKEVLLSR